MIADVYRTHLKGNYLFLPHGVPFSSLPQPVLDQCRSLQVYKTLDLELDLIGVNTKQVQQDIQTQGYSIQSLKLDHWEQN